MTIQLQLVSNMLLHLMCVLQCSYTVQGIGMMYLIMCLLHAMAAKSRLSHVTAVCISSPGNGLRTPGSRTLAVSFRGRSALMSKKEKSTMSSPTSPAGEQRAVR